MEADCHQVSVHPNTNQQLSPKRILIIEDDSDIARLLQLHLNDIYQTVTIANNGLEGYHTCLSQAWDLIVLDINLPDKDGLEICRDLRAEQQYIPILMLTSKSSELDRVLGLEMGADDYVTKPFSIIELTARIKAIFRRMSVDQSLSTESQKVIAHAHHIELDPKLHKVLKHNIEVDLTAKEFDLLHYFLKHPGCVFSRSQLLNDIWGYGHEGYEHTVNSHINRLRSKIEDDPNKPQIIMTVWGVGYKLNEQHG